MKKLVILMLVLGMATAANAVLTETLSAVGDDVAATVDLNGSSTVAGEAMTTFMVYTNTLESMTLVYTQPGSAITDMIGYAGNFETALGLAPGSVLAAKMIDIKDTGDPKVFANGQLVTSATSGAGTIYLLDQAGTTVLDQVTIVPEPMTIALLGLGGLFIRRKK